MAIEVHAAPVAELDATTIYAILRLRVDVFVVEQECAYPELDGRDLESGAVWLWANRSDDQQIIGTLRILTEPDGGRRIGRVATAKPARAAGIASALMTRAMDLCGDERVVLDAQSYTRTWYERFGFVRTGEEFLEDGIPHIPMTRFAVSSGGC
jgi:ElaA protein